MASEEHARLIGLTLSQLAGKKVTSRLLCPAPVLRSAAWRRSVGPVASAAEVRISGAVRQELVVVDGAAVIAPDASPGEPGGSGPR
ncbi:hypothetical protein NKH77_20530 [Streptomyces sp. M19]